MADFASMQYSLLRLDAASSDHPAANLITLISSSSYYDVLISKEVAGLFDLSFSGDLAKLKRDLKDRMLEYLSEDGGDLSPRDRQLIVATAGIASLAIFAQANWTGPPLAIPFAPIPALASVSADSALVLDWVRAELAREGEDAWSKLQYPVYLIVANVLLVDCSYALRLLDSAHWWRLRTLFRHQLVLSGPSPSLHDALSETAAEARRVVPPGDLTTMLELEIGLMHHYYRERTRTKNAFKAAQAAAQLTVEVTGVMGKRTAHQVDDTPQLVVTAQSQTASPVAAADTAPTAAAVSTAAEDVGLNVRVAAGVREFGLDDSDVLTRPKFLDQTDRPLSVLHQAVLLALCLDVKNSNPHHGLTSAEMMPYLERVSLTPQSNAVHSTCLLLRSRLEHDRSRLKERATMQMQALVDQYGMSHTATAAQRVHDVFYVAWPMRRDTQRELAEMMLSLGAASTAFELFSSLDLWEQAADCLVVAGKEKKAEEIVRQQIDARPTPRLLCLLGELTRDTAYFQKAWELSDGHFAMAQRLLGNSAMKANEFEAAASAYEQALRINFLFPKTWFALGCAYIRLDRYQDAATAFTRCIHLDPEEADAWNNLGSVHLTLKNNDDREEAFRCFKEAVKIKFDSVKLWENLTVIAMDIGDVQEAVEAMRRVLSLTSTQVNWKVLSVLVKLAGDESAFHSQVEWQGYVRLLHELVADVTSAVPSEPLAWRMAAAYFAARGNAKQVVECRLCECRSVQKAGWDRDTDMFAAVVAASLALTAAYRAVGDRTSIDAAISYLRPLVKRTDAVFGGTPDHTSLAQEQRALEALLATLPADAAAAAE